MVEWNALKQPATDGEIQRVEEYVGQLTYGEVILFIKCNVYKER